MKLEVSVPELVEVFKEIQKQPEQIFEMIRMDVREIVGDYMKAMMKAELTHFPGREPYARSQGDVNHRHGSCDRAFTLKNIGEVEVKVPRDRKGEFTTQVIPRSKQYEAEISRDLSLMFLAGISTRGLSMISKRLIGRKISHTEISSANADLTEAVEKWRMRDL
ncbi:MAG: transposase, partial [Deltaproteobacteria bacterium]|nr:transposase [Deltaproteobacteria bacterium]